MEEDKIVVDDPAFTLTSIFGRIALVAYIVCTAIVALNMLIAMMNNSFERVMVSAFIMFQNRHLISVSSLARGDMITAFITYGAKLLNADWLRQRAFFLNHEGTFW